MHDQPSPSRAPDGRIDRRRAEDAARKARAQAARDLIAALTGRSRPR